MVKYALYKYSTHNIGDEIQSIAARRFLPQIDYYIDRDYINDWVNPNQSEKVKLITNGWYTHNQEGWPPRDKTLDILPISMHISSEKNCDNNNHKFMPRDTFASDEAVEFFKKFKKVGARDKDTYRFFDSKGIKAYFSGCITLTLQPDKRIKKQDFILASDISDELFDFLKAQTNRTIIKMSPYGSAELPTEDKFLLAEYFLYLYQSAHAVITTRLHSALPSLALQTPVLLIRPEWGLDPARYEGLDDLVHTSTDKEYIRNYKKIFNLDNPPENPKKYLPIRHDLIQTCKNFTGYDNNKTFLTVNPNTFLINEDITKLILFTNRESLYLYDELNLVKKSVEYKKKENDNLRQQIIDLTRKNKGLIDDYNSIKNTSMAYILRVLRNRFFKN